MAKDVFAAMAKTGKNPSELVKEMGMSQITDESSILTMIQEILKAHPENVAEYKSGKTKEFGFFVGQVMKKSKGQANPEILNKLLKKELDS